jgi:vacuolar-type H+-ATPase subunit I/STV1
VEKELSPQHLLKEKIFEAYRNCINAPSPDLLSKHSGQLWVLIDRWCKKYLFVEEWEEKEDETVEAMLEGIPDIIDRLVKEDRKIKTHEEPGEFITYLNGCLKKLKAKTFYELLPEKVNKTKVKKYFQINRLIETRERDGKLKENDRVKIIANYMPIYKYKEIKDNVLNILELDRFTHSDDEDNEISLLNSPNVKSIFDNTESTNKFDVSPEKLMEAVRYVLENRRQKRTRACNRALFTVECIKKASHDYASHDYLEELAPVLDSELLNTYRKSGIKPTQYEVYLKYHPKRMDSSEESVETNASSDLAKFRDDLEIYLRESP